MLPWKAWMRILLDESLPRRFKDLLEDHEVLSVQEAGWSGKQNGELLTLASESFDVFVTPDRNMPHQQNLAEYKVSLVVLSTGSNRMHSYRSLASQIREAVQNAKAGEATWVTA